MCWYPRLLGTIPLLLDVVVTVNAHVCCVLRKISNIRKKIWCFPIKNSLLAQIKSIDPQVDPDNMSILPRQFDFVAFRGATHAQCGGIGSGSAPGRMVVKAFWRAFDDLPYFGKMEDLVKLGFSWIFPNRSGGFRWSKDSGKKHT